MTQQELDRHTDHILGEKGKRRKCTRNTVRYGELEFRKGKFVLTHFGDRSVFAHIEALHAVPPNHDHRTAFIVDEVVRAIDCSAIVAEKSRDAVDLNRPPDSSTPLTVQAVMEYRQSIRDILAHLGIIEGIQLSRPYLHLSIHGMQDQKDCDISIGTRNGTLAQTDLVSYVVNHLVCTGFRVKVDSPFLGSQALEQIKIGVPDFENLTGYGIPYNILSIEIANWIRYEKSDDFRRLVDTLTAIVLGFSPIFT